MTGDNGSERDGKFPFRGSVMEVLRFCSLGSIGVRLDFSILQMRREVDQEEDEARG